MGERVEHALLLGTQRGLLRWPDDWLLGDMPVHGVQTLPDGTILAAGWRRAGLWRIEDDDPVQVEEGSFRVVRAAPEEPTLLYAGTRPVDLFRSRDAGRTWSRLPGVHVVTEHPFPDDHYIRGLAIPGGSADTVYAGVEGLGTGGVLRSDDRGESWRLTALEHDIHDLVCPGAVDVVFASSGHGLFLSDDGGDSWGMRMSGIDRSYPMALHRTRGGSLYLSVAEGPPPYWQGRSEGADSALYCSVDDGLDWFRVVDPDRAPIHAVTSAPDGTVYAGRGDGTLYAGDADGMAVVERCPAGILCLEVAAEAARS